MIDFDLTEADKSILDIAHKQAAVYRRYARRYDQDQAHGLDLDVIPEEQDFVHARHLAAESTEETSGYDVLEALIYLEEIWGGKPVRYMGPDGDTMNFMLSNEVLKIVGTPEQIDRWGKTFFCYGLTEPGAGSDPAGVLTMAVYDSETDEWVINGEKTFISLGEASEAVMVLARFIGPDGERGLSNFVVEKGTPGFTIGPQIKKMGQRGADVTPLSFTDCRVPRFNHLAGDLRATLSILNGTRALVGVQGLGYAKAALDIVREKLAESGRLPDYGKGVGGQSAVAMQLMRLEAYYEAALLSVLRAQWVKQYYGNPDKVSAAIAKAMGGRLVRRVTQEAMDLLGPFSISEEHILELVFRDSRIVDIYEGPGEIQKLIIGRDLLSYSQKELN